MKKIAFLISGNIRIYEKNLVFFEEIKKILKDFEIIIVSSIWENQEDLENFKEKYKIKFIKKIKQKNWNDKINAVKFVTGEENLSWKIENVFHMWHSIVENVHFLEKINSENNLNIDYVCRFRTDIINLKSIENLKNDLIDLENEEFLISSNRHFKGITDLFFIAKYQTFLKLKNIFSFFDKFSQENRVFNPEYIFYCFLSESKFRIKIAHKFNLALIRMEEAKPTKRVYVPLKDKINMKMIALTNMILKFTVTSLRHSWCSFCTVNNCFWIFSIWCLRDKKFS